ncbi:hypothetical protein Taro_021653, partial [Colocasia esculenta]|nr:hypothetical protein [Colocasia esculenta]
SVDSFSILPSPVWYMCGLWAAAGWSILWVCLSAGVATAVHVTTPEEASGQVAVAVPFPVVMVTSLCLVTEGDTFVAVSWPRCQEGRVCRSGSAWFLLCLPRLFARYLTLEGLSHLEVVSVALDPHPQKPVEGVLWATSVPELAVDLAYSGAKEKMSPWWHQRVWFPDLVVCPGWFCLSALDLMEVCGFPARFLAVDSLAVVFPVWRTVFGKSSSGEVLPEFFSVGSGGSEGLRYAIDLAGAFWWVFLEWCLGGSGGGSPRTGLQVLPKSVLCSFRTTVALPLWFEVCRLVGLCSVCLGVVGQGVVPLTVCPAVALARLPCCSFLSFSGTSCVPMGWVVCFASHAQLGLADGGLVSCGESFPLACVVSAAGAPVWLLGLMMATCVVSYHLIVNFMCRFMTLLGVGGIGVLLVIEVGCWSVGPNSGVCWSLQPCGFRLAFSAVRAGFGVARHLWGCRSIWAPHVWLE